MTAITITTDAYSATVEARFATPGEAAEFAARFPKSTKLASPSLNGYTLVGRENGQTVETGIIRVSVKLAEDGVNGGQNEAGLKRLATIRRTAAKLGIEVVEN
jgi:hypothetical protein